MWGHGPGEPGCRVSVRPRSASTWGCARCLVWSESQQQDEMMAGDGAGREATRWRRAISMSPPRPRTDRIGVLQRGLDFARLYALCLEDVRRPVVSFTSYQARVSECPRFASAPVIASPAHQSHARHCRTPYAAARNARILVCRPVGPSIPLRSTPSPLLLFFLSLPHPPRHPHPPHLPRSLLLPSPRQLHSSLKMPKPRASEPARPAGSKSAGKRNASQPTAPTSSPKFYVRAASPRTTQPR